MSSVQLNFIALRSALRYKVRLIFDSTVTEKANVQSLSGNR